MAQTQTLNKGDVIKKIYDAINQNDIPGALSFFLPEIVRIEWAGLPSEKRVRGLEDLSTHLKQGREAWDEGRCEPVTTFEAGEKMVVDLHVHVLLKSKTEWIDGRIGDVFTFKDGKVVEFRSFMKVQEALEWAKVKT